MRKITVVAGVSSALVAGTAMGAFSAQGRQDAAVPGTERPGQATRARVWVENRGRDESIPISAAAPLPVIVQNIMRQWEYQTLNVGPGTSPAELTRLLTAQGLAGWETAGVQVMSGANTLVVLKRPRMEAQHP
jgi:hypothetical protein